MHSKQCNVSMPKLLGSHTLHVHVFERTVLPA